MAELDVTSPYHLTTASLDDAQQASTWIVDAEGTLLFAGPALPHPWSAEDLLATRNQGWQVFALRQADRAVGIGSIHTNAERAHLGRLLVDPNCRGQGLGKALVLELLDHAHQLGFQRVTLNVYEHNTIARQLYEKLGFRIEQRHEAPGQRTSLHMAAPVPE